MLLVVWAKFEQTRISFFPLRLILVMILAMSGGNNLAIISTFQVLSGRMRS